MADIKQAAKWMKEGKKVRRADTDFVWDADTEFVSDQNGDECMHIDDLLADDWEVVA